MPRPQSEAPGPGVVVEGVREVKQAFQAAKYTKTAKNGGFVHVLANKSPKTLFFAQKYLT